MNNEVIIYGKKVALPADEDIVVRTWEDHGLRFTAKQGGVRPRKSKPYLNLLHWTGSENPAKRVFANLLKRKSAGAPYGLSCHAVLDYDGVLWQFADFGTDITLHGGEVNPISNGFEIQSKAFPPAAAAVPRGTQRQFIKGRDRSVLTFTTPQINTIGAVLYTMNQVFKIPDEIPGWEDDDKELEIYPYALPPGVVFKGTACHFHFSRKNKKKINGVTKYVTVKDKDGRIISGKLDAGLQLLQMLRDEEGYHPADVGP